MTEAIDTWKQANRDKGNIAQLDAPTITRAQRENKLEEWAQILQDAKEARLSRKEAQEVIHKVFKEKLEQEMHTLQIDYFYDLKDFQKRFEALWPEQKKGVRAWISKKLLRLTRKKE